MIQVSVPMTAYPGGYIDVCIDDEEQDGEIEFKLKKSTIGAAVAGKVYDTEDHLFIHVLLSSSGIM